MRPPNYRETDECIACKYVVCTHSCGCCPPEYECSKHNYNVYYCHICDDFESSEQ